VQLRRVRLRNIRSYESADVKFEPGTTLIVGDVGAGKTSLLYAAEMALFGFAEVDPTYLVRHGSGRAEVEAEFEDAEHRYALRREFRTVRRRGRATFEPERISFRVDGSETAYSATELRQRVIELLGFADDPNPHTTSDVWRWAVYVPQERMRDILSARPQDRLETVRRALGVERYRIAAENAQEIAADLRRSAAARRSESERLLHHERDHADWREASDRLLAERAATQVELGEAENAQRAALAKKERAEAAERATETTRALRDTLLREEASDAKAVLERERGLEERAAEIDARQGEAAVARGEAAALDQDESERAEAEAARERARSGLETLADQVRELIGARARLAEEERRLSDATAAVERAARDVTDRNAQREKVRQEGPSREPPSPTPASLGTIDAELERAREEEASALHDLALAQGSLTELTELLGGGVCPRCHQTVDPAGFEPHRREAETALESAEAKRARLQGEVRRLEETRKSRERFERAFERWSEVEKRRALIDRALAESEQILQEHGETERKARRAVDEARARAQTLAPVEAQEAELRTDLATAERRLDAAIERTARSAQALERWHGIEAILRGLVGEQARREEELGEIRSRRTERLRQIRELPDDAAERDARHRATAASVESLARAESALADVRARRVRIDTRLDEASRRVAEAERGRSERAALQVEIEDLTRKAAWLSGPFRTSVLAMEQQLLAAAQSVFDRQFSRYFASLVEDPGVLARIDAAFTPGVMIDDEWTPAEALSGGERTSLALAFRLALAHVVRHLGSVRIETLILDEPTDGFSPEQVVRMGELLEELQVPQLVLVSHEIELAAIADRVVRVAKQNGRSRVERAEGGPASPPSIAEPETSPGAPRRRRGTRRRLD
jgi:DNA repair protein SbcC/Rad50